MLHDRRAPRLFATSCSTSEQDAPSRAQTQVLNMSPACSSRSEACFARAVPPIWDTGVPLAVSFRVPKV